MPKTEAASTTASVSNDTWKFLPSLTLDNQPKATPVNLFTSQAPVSTTTGPGVSSTAQDYPTVNLADLHGLTFGGFPTAQDSGLVNAASRSNRETSNAAVGSQSHQASMAPDPAQDFTYSDEDLPEFPSFSDQQSSGNLDNILDEFQTLLAQTNETAITAATVIGAQASGCQLTSSIPCSTAATNMAHPVANHMGNDSTTTTLMNYPASLANLLHSDCSISSPNVPQIPISLDDMDMNSIDDDRLMSILNCNQAGFLEGHPT